MWYNALLKAMSTFSIFMFMSSAVAVLYDPNRAMVQFSATSLFVYSVTNMIRVWIRPVNDIMIYEGL